MRRIDSKHAVPEPHSLPSLRLLTVLMNLAKSEDVDYADFCDAIDDESVIATDIMRAARLAALGREDGIRGLRHAVAMIGLREVRSILEKLVARVQQEELQRARLKA